MLHLTHWIVPQFTIATFWWAALAAIIVSGVNGLAHMFFGRPGRRGEGEAIDGRRGGEGKVRRSWAGGEAGVQPHGEAPKRAGGPGVAVPCFGTIGEQAIRDHL